jgi:serine/threonine-protein kinase
MPTSPDTTSAPATVDDSLVGQKVHKYDIVRVIGRGGMGMVYEAVNTAIGKRVAMKFVDAELAQNKDAVARFQREAQAASAVESAHIVEIFDSGETEDGLPFIVMELLRGEDLGHRIKRCGRLDLPEALHVTAQILRGLHRAHEAGIVHRDLKPDNIFLVDRDDDPNFAKILDFGISKVQRRGDVPAHTLTRQGTVLGTPFYMSPEQAQALPDIDGRTDLWSVGAILFECLTGRPPHSGGTYEQVIVSICMHDVDDVRAHNPGVPEGVARVLARALTRDRDVRFGSARELLDALAAASGGVISHRSTRSDDGTTSAPGASQPTPRSGSTPFGSNPRSDAELAPTLEVGSGGPSRVGWSTSRRRAHGGRDRRVVLGIALGSLLLGTLAGVAWFRQSPEGSTLAPTAKAETAVDVQLRSNAPGARFFTDGAEVQGGVVRGAPGDKRTVRVEADGFAPAERVIELDPARPSIEIALSRPEPVVSPAVESAAPSASAAASAAPVTKTTRPGRPPVATPKTSAQPSAAPAATPAPTPPPAVTSKGVAGGLQLKTE